jgi:metal-responsive CopG/Arc/MetJ family transcriptional regulator
MAPAMKSEYDHFSISLPIALKEQFEQICSHLKMSRSDAIRKAMHLFINDTSEQVNNLFHGQILGTITYLEMAHVHNHPDDHQVQDTSQPISKSHDSTSSDDNKGAHSHYFHHEELEYIEINTLQHQFLDIILSTTHIHAGLDKCMLIIAVKGDITRVYALLEKLRQFHTITNIQLSIVEKV